MEKEIKLYDIVAVKNDHIFYDSHGTMHCKKGTQGRVLDIGFDKKREETYYIVEFFDKSEIFDPVFDLYKDELELVETSEEEQAHFLKNHPEYINDEKWLKANHYDLKKIKEIWARDKK